MDSFLTMFIAAFLGQSFVRILGYLIDAVIDYRALRKPHSSDTSEDEP